MERVPVKFKKVRAVTLPHFKIEKNREYYFRFESLMEIGKDAKITRPDAEPSKSERRRPPMLAHVTDLETGELGQIICPAVLVSELNDNYPEGAYVGRCFAIEQYRVPGKDYNLINLTEIEADETPSRPAGEPESHPHTKPEQAKGNGKRKAA